MTRALLYKEWLKTRWIIAVIAVAGLVLHVYMFVRLGRTFRMAGHEHLWDVIINRDSFLFYDMKYFPLIAGLFVGLFQFVPELLQKKLKLTLHLPMAEYRIISYMVAYGVVLLLMFFVVHASILFWGISLHFATPVLVSAINTVLPWYLAGLVAYQACAFVCTEPTWKRRISDIFLSIVVIRVFFISDFPGAYSKMATWLPFLIPVFWLFIYLSIYRFKAGTQD
jgi:hypothetical protein